MLAETVQPCPVDAMQLPRVLVRPTSGRVEGLPCSVLVPQYNRVAAMLMCQVVPELLLDRADHLAVSLSLVPLYTPHAPASTCPDLSAHRQIRPGLYHAHEGNPDPQAADSAV